MTDLLRWLDDPSTVHGVRVASGRGSANAYSYESLAERVLRAAGGLRALNRPGSVLVMQPELHDFFVGFFAGLCGGHAVAPVPPPQPVSLDVGYAERFEAMLRQLRPSVLLVADDEVERMKSLSGGAEVTTLTELESYGPVAAPPSPPATSTALIQFTSGSSGNPRGVLISHAALGANATAIQDWLRLTPEQTTVSWLPLHHDMGLVGCMVTPVMAGSTVDLSRPRDFVRSPLSYLQRMSGISSVTAMPNFGLEYIVRRVTPDQVDDLDLSGVRTLILGAERINPRAIDTFLQLVEPTGFAPEAVCPAYGLAEATLAVTGSPLDRHPSFDSTVIGTPVVGCGVPLRGTSIKIVDDGGEPIEDGAVGEIVVESASLLTSYAGDAGADGPSTCLATGDAGYRLDGELYVLGRFGDAVKVRGKSLFSEEVEALLVDRGLVNREKQVVLLGTQPNSDPVVVVVVEARPDAELAAEISEEVDHLISEIDCVVQFVPNRTIQRTTSGKPRRRPMWASFAEGTLAGQRFGTVGRPDPAVSVATANTGALS